ncbi:MAG: PilZ domain-containing protein [Pseudomonadota bacterium]
MVIKRLLRLWSKEGYEAPEKREFVRLVYPSRQRPKFKVREYEMEVIDISEKGITFLKNKQTKISQCIYGTVVLLSGKSINITGKIAWQEENGVGLLAKRILPSIILQEIQALLRQKGSNEP